MVLDFIAHTKRAIFVAQAVHDMGIRRHDPLEAQGAERRDHALGHALERCFVAEPARNVAGIGLLTLTQRNISGKA